MYFVCGPSVRQDALSICQICVSWLMSLFKCSSLLSVGSFALIMSHSFICALMFSGSRGLLGLILPFGM